MGIWGSDRGDATVVVNPWLARRLRAEARHREETPRRFVLSAIGAAKPSTTLGYSSSFRLISRSGIRAASQTPDLPYVINAVEAALHRDER